MMVSYTRLWTAGLFCLVMLVAISCSGGGGSPIAPSPGGDPGPGLTSGTDPGTVPDLSAQGDNPSDNGTSIWGIYDFVYDWNTGEFEIMPVRGAQFTLNINQFLQPPAGNPSNLGVSIKDATQLMSDGILTLNVEITHPIDNPKLVGFDTMGVLIGNGTILFDEDTDCLFAGPDDLHLINPDGFTRWMNPLEFTDSGLFGYTEGMLGTPGIDWTATVNGYKYFADGLDATVPLRDYLDTTAFQDLRGAFLPGTSNAREYQIQFPMVGGFPVVKFQYGIISHWVAAKDGNGDPIPEPVISDFPPEANAAEAVCVVANATGSTLYFDENTHETGGDLIINVTVYDWQGMAILGGTGAWAEINSFGLSSPDGLLPSPGINMDAGATGVSEVSSGVNSTTLSLLIEGATPSASGAHRLILAVYSEDPNDYNPGGPGTYPMGARLASFTMLSVDVLPEGPGENQPPVIDEIQGPLEVSCWDTDTLYTCIASDPNPGDTLMYQWIVVFEGEPPFYLNPPTEENTAIIDWSDDFNFPAGMYQLYFNVTDGEFMNESFISIEKMSTGLLVHDITADEEDTNNVFCTNEDALYTITAESCDPGAEISYRWIRGYGTPPSEIDPEDPGWSPWSLDNTITYSWNGTEIGTWWIVAEAWDQIAFPVKGNFYNVERIDTPPSDVQPPIGATDVNCSNDSEIYALTGGEDCDGGTNEREWTITSSPTPPTGGWVSAVNDQFIVDWGNYPMGTYYAWQRVGSGASWSVSDPLEVIRGNTPPDMPEVPNGPVFVSCVDTNAEYDAGEVTDCEGDTVSREWAIGIDLLPPTSGWTAFSGETFEVDFSSVPNGSGYLFQRASDNGFDWSYSDPLSVNKINSPPDVPPVVSGPETVSCYDDAALYDAGVVTDCDAGSIITRSYMIGDNPDIPLGDWIEFTGDSFIIDWSSMSSQSWYVFQKASDGVLEAISLSLAILKDNAPPEIGAPSGPTDVDCSSTEVVYTETSLFDCDPGTLLFTMYYLSLSADEQFGGFWTPYDEGSFQIDFQNMPSDDYWLFLSANDGFDETIGDPLHIVRHNTAPNKPDIPDGPTEVDCSTNPTFYQGGLITDCDPTDVHTREHYISTDPITPAGGEWISDLGDLLVVDYIGVTAEQPYYLFQRVSDGDLSAVSDSLEVIYHNTAPDAPGAPTGQTNVSCANDNEIYDGHAVNDCDTWQALTRSYAINDINIQPAVGWTEFAGSTWAIDWSLYDQDTYYMFQRVWDGYAYAYSSSLVITVGPPNLIPPPAPTGAADVDCDGPIEIYDADDYMAGCPDVEITRDWAINQFPTPPPIGWVEFPGTTFDVDPADLGFGTVYLYQRARLDLQEEISPPLVITVHPGALGDPATPIGATTVDCSSDNESYDMGDTVTAACPDTPMVRDWQVQDMLGTPMNLWQEIHSNPIFIDWTQFPAGADYQLIQRADDGDHTTYSSPLIVTFQNYVPEFLGGISGPTPTTCTDIFALYNGGEVYDCDQGQILTREWAMNTEPVYPIDGWLSILGSQFSVNYSHPDIQPGDVYLFQRVSDGVTTEYDPVPFHVVYNNTPPEIPEPPQGSTIITCLFLEQIYIAPPAFDCDGTILEQFWALNDIDEPPTGSWAPIIGDEFSIDWSTLPFGQYFLYQKASDGLAESISPPLIINKINTAPTINSFTCDEGIGPFTTDGTTPPLPGLPLVNSLNFTFDVNDCDEETLFNYWAVTTTPVPESFGDPSWNGPVGGSTFEIDLSAFTSLAPASLFIHFGSYDGTNFTTTLWTGSLDMWELVWLTQFSSPGEMWTENGCIPGIGGYAWNYDDVNDYLRLESYGSASASSVWSEPVAFPTPPGLGQDAYLLSYMNPALAAGLDNSYFGFLKDTGCEDYTLEIFFGEGCGSENPGLAQFNIPQIAPIWGDSRRVGIFENGFDGCDPSNFYIDWTGIWIQPTH